MLWDNSAKFPCQQVNIAAQSQLPRRGSTAPLRVQTNGKFNGFPKFPITEWWPQAFYGGRTRLSDDPRHWLYFYEWWPLGALARNESERSWTCRRNTFLFHSEKLIRVTSKPPYIRLGQGVKTERRTHCRRRTNDDVTRWLPLRTVTSQGSNVSLTVLTLQYHCRQFPMSINVETPRFIARFIKQSTTSIKSYIFNVWMFLTIATVVYYICCISCTQLTRSVLIAIVKDVCWEIIFFVLSYYHSK